MVEEPDGAAPSDATAIDDLSLTLQQSIVDADPQFITLIRNEQGDLLETVGLYASYPSFLRHIPFDKNDLERVYQIAAGGHEYRGITYAANDEGETTYLQTLVNVDSEIAILDGFTRTLIVYLAAAVVVAAGASYLLSRRTLKPIVANMRAQTEFVQNASHELRTPLAVIQTTGELLLDSPNSRIVDRFEDVNAITSETKRLARLVDDLMELSLGDAGRSSLDASAVNLDALVREACAAYEDFATLQDKRLEVETGSRETIEADADKLRQLLGIVLDNALKYTAPGDEITVRTRASGPKQCVVEVADTGTYSSGSIAPTRPARARRAATGWGSRSRNTSWKRTAAPSPSNPTNRAARSSSSRCPQTRLKESIRSKTSAPAPSGRGGRAIRSSS